MKINNCIVEFEILNKGYAGHIKDMKKKLNPLSKKKSSKPTDENYIKPLFIDPEEDNV